MMEWNLYFLGEVGFQPFRSMNQAGSPLDSEQGNRLANPVFDQSEISFIPYADTIRYVLPKL